MVKCRNYRLDGTVTNKEKKPKRRWRSEEEILAAINRVQSRKLRHLGAAEDKGLCEAMRNRGERLAHVAELQLGKLGRQLSVFRTMPLALDDVNLRDHSIPR